MKNDSILSIAPYYGGKSRMAHFIIERLDYENTNVFVTPFGGMCRVLLNKPRHNVECYNDLNSGLYALMSILSHPENASKFIHRLYNETEFSEDEFLRQRAIYQNAEIDLEKQEKEKLRQLLISKNIVIPVVANKVLNIIYNQIYKDDTQEIKITSKLQSYIDRLQEFLKEDIDFRNEFQDKLAKWLLVYEAKQEYDYFPRATEIGEDISDMDLAIATYITFKMSQNGMGKAFSKEKFKSNKEYLDSILNLYDCAKRMEGVQIFQINAMDFFCRKDLLQDMEQSTSMLGEWLDDPKVMMYCDPSYISPASEQKLLDGIDIENVDSLSEAIDKKYEGKRFPKNLGEVYSCSFGYNEQEAFLRCIQNAKCRIMVSNYDLELYNKYLNPDTGWRREEFITTTSVGGKANNSRVEVIWYNY